MPANHKKKKPKKEKVYRVPVQYSFVVGENALFLRTNRKKPTKNHKDENKEK